MLYRNYLKDKYQSAYRLEIVEGVPCVLKYSKGKNIKNYEIYGNSVQDGTPSSDNPIEVQSTGDLVTDKTSEYYGKYDVPVTVCRKNLIPYPHFHTTMTTNGITFTDNGDGTITANGTATSTAYYKLRNNTWNDEIPLSAGTYTLSGCPSGGGSSIYTLTLWGRINENASRKLYATDTGLGKTVTLNYGKYDFIITVIKGTLCDNVVFKPQLELGSSATIYEPYTSETKHIYLDEPLRKVGDYVDYIDYKNQKVVRNIKEITLNGSENWSLQGTNENGIISFIYSMPILNETASSSINVSGLSTHYPCKITNLSSATEQGFFVRIGASATNIYIRMLNEDIADITAFKTWLSENNVTIYYQMTTPTEEPILLPTLQTFKNTTSVSVNTSIQPSNIKTKYIRT